MAYLILWAESDNVGVWKPHFREWYFKLKQEINPKDFLDKVNSDYKRIEVLSSGDWWLIDYLPLQVRTLTPNNRPHVSYIEDLREHGLLTRYAKENPENVKFEVIEELEDWENIKDFEKKKKAKSAYRYLDSKGLIQPLKEACKTLARLCQDSKEKEQEKDQKQDEARDKEQSLTLNFDCGYSMKYILSTIFIAASSCVIQSNGCASSGQYVYQGHIGYAGQNDYAVFAGEDTVGVQMSAKKAQKYNEGNTYHICFDSDKNVLSIR